MSGGDAKAIATHRELLSSCGDLFGGHDVIEDGSVDQIGPTSTLKRLEH